MIIRIVSDTQKKSSIVACCDDDDDNDDYNAYKNISRVPETNGFIFEKRSRID